ncbi:hypothetical protein [Nonomuraea sp. NPDC048916]
MGLLNDALEAHGRLARRRDPTTVRVAPDDRAGGARPARASAGATR